MVNHACNLRCTYCYTGDKFNRKMPTDIAITAIDRALASIQPGGILELGFFGGEPLIEAVMIRRLIEYASQAASENHIAIKPSITTNGTIISNAALDVMHLDGMQLAISHDGLPEIHDRHRPTADGKQSSSLVEATIRHLVGAKIDFSVVMVVRPDSVQQMDKGVEHLFQLGVRRIEPSVDLWTSWGPADIANLEHAIHRCAKIWRDGLPERAIGWFDEKVGLMSGLHIHPSAQCGFGNGEIAVAPSGALYPCERLIGEDLDTNPMRLPAHALNGRDFLSIRSHSPRSHDECNGCSMNSLCNTTCRCGNFVRSGNVATPDELLCTWNQSCLDAVAELISISAAAPC